MSDTIRLVPRRWVVGCIAIVDPNTNVAAHGTSDGVRIARVQFSHQVGGGIDIVVGICLLLMHQHPVTTFNRTNVEPNLAVVPDKVIVIQPRFTAGNLHHNVVGATLLQFRWANQHQGHGSATNVIVPFSVVPTQLSILGGIKTHFRGIVIGIGIPA